MREFKKVINNSRTSLPNYNDLVAEYDKMHDLVQTLVYSIFIDTRLVQAYREEGRFDEAVVLATELYDYDPLNLTYLGYIVDVTIDSLRKGVAVSPEKLREAQSNAAELRNAAKRPDERYDYWLASIQLLEISYALGDIDLMNRTLMRFGQRGAHPARDLRTPVGLTATLDDLNDGQMLAYDKQDGALVPRGKLTRQHSSLIQRFQAIYQLDGITTAAKYRLEPAVRFNADQEITVFCAQAGKLISANNDE